MFGYFRELHVTLKKQYQFKEAIFTPEMMNDLIDPINLMWQAVIVESKVFKDSD